MTGEGILAMRVRDLQRLKVVQRVIEKQVIERVAAGIIGCSERQVRRLVKRVREEGVGGLIHKARGKASNRKFPDKVKKKVVKLYRKKYAGFGPTLASEKLREVEKIAVSDETLRKWLLERGLWRKRRKRSAHRRWRARKECCGEMIQMDGSHHDWLEGRGPALVLMAYIDDATNRVFARFYDYEGTMPAMDSFLRYVRMYGLPQSVYLDRHTTYKSNKKLTPEEELRGQSEPLSQFERALEELGVEVIHAYSPQAKGRIERLFGVFQDRLVKEMRLEGVSTKAKANKFLETYLPRYNRKFGVSAAQEADVHVPVDRHFPLERYLCVKETRTVRNDNTVAYEGQLYQIEERTRVRTVMVEERLNGSLHITSGDVDLKFQAIAQRPKTAAPPKRPKPRKAHIPAKDHPWRQWHNRRPSTEREICSY
jgi:hypothetical protein